MFAVVLYNKQFEGGSATFELLIARKSAHSYGAAGWYV